jgi:chromosome segregation ATPase
MSEKDVFGGIENDITNLEENFKKAIDSQAQDLTRQFEVVNVKIAEHLQKLILNLTNQLESVNNKISEVVEQLTSDFVSQFGGITGKIQEIMTNQVKELTLQVHNVKDIVSQSVDNLHLGPLHQSVMEVVNNVLNLWLINVPQSLFLPIKEIQKSSEEGLKMTRENIVIYFNNIEKIILDGILTTSVGVNQQMKEVQYISEEGVEKSIQKLNTVLLHELQKSMENPVGNITESLEKQLEAAREEVKFLELEKKGLAIAIRKLTEARKELEGEKTQLIKDKQERDEKIDMITGEQRKLLEEYKQLKVDLQKFANVAAASETKEPDDYDVDEISSLLKIYTILIEKIFSGFAHFRILDNLHGDKEAMTRDELKMATGIGGAFVLNALNELHRVGLLEYDMNTDTAKLIKRLYPKKTN